MTKEVVESFVKSLSLDDLNFDLDTLSPRMEEKVEGMTLFLWK